MDIVENIFLWDEEKGLLNQAYINSDINIQDLAKALPSDEVTENIDKGIESLIVLVLMLKKELKTANKVKEYITAVLLETEVKTV